MGLSTATLNALDGCMHGQGNAEELAAAINQTASLGGNLTATAAELNLNHGVTAGTVSAGLQVAAGANKQIDTLAVASLISGTTATPGSVNQSITVINQKVLADATATSVFTVTCPNGEHAAVVEVILLCAVKKTATSTLESARCAVGYVVFNRTTGAALVGTASALTNTGIATSGTDTLTLAYSVGAVAGAVGAVNTMDIKVTGTGSGTDTEIVTALATIINSQASGMTIASD